MSVEPSQEAQTTAVRVAEGLAANRMLSGHPVLHQMANAATRLTGGAVYFVRTSVRDGVAYYHFWADQEMRMDLDRTVRFLDMVVYYSRRQRVSGSQSGVDSTQGGNGIYSGIAALTT